MKNTDELMKNLIDDSNILVYLHDLLSYSKKHEDFFTSDTYIELHESDVLTGIKYLKRMIFTISSFGLVMYLLKNIMSYLPQSLLYLIMVAISLLFGWLIVLCKNDIKDLRYQLKTKKAAQYALSHYNYEQFVIFIDKYLSEVSTNSYNNKLNSKNVK